MDPVDASSFMEKIVAAGIILGALAFLANTPLYPVAFGVAALALLYAFLANPVKFSGPITWASGVLKS